MKQPPALLLFRELVSHLVELSHGGAGRRNDIVDEEEESILGSQLNSFPDQEIELAHCKIRKSSKNMNFFLHGQTNYYYMYMYSVDSCRNGRQKCLDINNIALPYPHNPQNT